MSKIQNPPFYLHFLANTLPVKFVYSIIQCDIIIKNLQRKPIMDGGTLKRSPNQEIFISTFFYITFHLEITRLQKFCISIVFILWLAFFTNHHMKAIEKHTNFDGS